MMQKYCKECGSLVAFEYGATETDCPNCGKVSYDKTMHTFTLEIRMTQLKAMDEIMSNANDEYIQFAWFTDGIPNGPSEDDFFSVALQDEDYNEIFDLFVELIAKKGVRY